MRTSLTMREYQVLLVVLECRSSPQPITDRHCNPTLACCASFTKEGKEDAEKFIKDPRVARFLTAEHKGTMCKCMSLANDEARVEYAYESVRMMKAAGIDIIV